MQPTKITSPGVRIPGKGGKGLFYQCDDGEFYLQNQLAVIAKKSQGYFNVLINQYGWDFPRLLDPTWHPRSDTIAKRKSRVMPEAKIGGDVTYDDAVKIVFGMIEDAKVNVVLYRDNPRFAKEHRDSISFLKNKNGGLEDLLGLIAGVNVEESLKALSRFVGGNVRAE